MKRRKGSKRYKAVHGRPSILCHVERRFARRNSCLARKERILFWAKWSRLRLFLYLFGVAQWHLIFALFAWKIYLMCCSVSTIQSHNDQNLQRASNGTYVLNIYTLVTASHLVINDVSSRTWVVSARHFPMFLKIICGYKTLIGLGRTSQHSQDDCSLTFITNQMKTKSILTPCPGLKFWALKNQLAMPEQAWDSISTAGALKGFRSYRLWLREKIGRDASRIRFQTVAKLRCLHCTGVLSSL